MVVLGLLNLIRKFNRPSFSKASESQYLPRSLFEPTQTLETRITLALRPISLTREHNLLVSSALVPIPAAMESPVAVVWNSDSYGLTSVVRQAVCTRPVPQPPDTLHHGCLDEHSRIAACQIHPHSHVVAPFSGQHRRHQTRGVVPQALSLRAHPCADQSGKTRLVTGSHHLLGELLVTRGLGTKLGSRGGKQLSKFGASPMALLS